MVKPVTVRRERPDEYAQRMRAGYAGTAFDGTTEEWNQRHYIIRFHGRIVGTHHNILTVNRMAHEFGSRFNEEPLPLFETSNG